MGIAGPEQAIANVAYSNVQRSASIIQGRGCAALRFNASATDS